tara:strand:+ start:2662 stop:4467 length:1806 start_codon:yes stop_codon:yes gene_type:complete
MDVKYGDFSFKNEKLAIPTVDIQTSFNKTEAGAILSHVYDITLAGKIMATGNRAGSSDGSLNTADNYDGQESNGAAQTVLWEGLIIAANDIKKAFDEDYKKLEILCSDNTDTLIWGLSEDTTSARVTNLNFENSTDENWNQIIDYSIGLQVVKPSPSYQDYYGEPNPSTVSSFQDSYEISPITEDSFYIPADPVLTDNDPSTSTYNENNQGNLFPMGSGGGNRYTITRTVGANGIKSSKYGSALDNGKSFVTGVLLKSPQISEILQNLTLTNRTTSIQASEADGRYEITDTFTASDSSFFEATRETFTVTNNVDRNFRKTATIAGTIFGQAALSKDVDSLYWGITNPSDTVHADKLFIVPLSSSEVSAENAYKSASGQFQALLDADIFHKRCLAVSFPSGISQEYQKISNNQGATTALPFKNFTGWLNPIAVNGTSTHSPRDSKIDYSFTFDSRPLSLIKGAFNESIDVSDSHPVRNYSMQEVFLRNPILQDRGTYSLPTRTATYSATFFPEEVSRSAVAYINNTTLSRIYTALDQFNPNRMNAQNAGNYGNGRYYIISRITKEDEQYDPIGGTFSKSVTWSYEFMYGSWLKISQLETGLY